MARKRLIFSFLLMLFFAWSGNATKSAQLRKMDNVRLSAGVTLTPLVPQGTGENLREAIIVCPGGSYHWLDEPTEGLYVAQWLQKEGIAAFVLLYNPYTTLHTKIMGAISDAIEHVRSFAGEYGVDPDRIGAMGFSAGGHLVMSAAEHFASDPARRLNFVAPIYPVVTMNEPYVHKRSMRGFLSPREIASAEGRDRFSLEKNVPQNCPPVFLLNCTDDPIVKYQNSILLAEALSCAGVEHLYTRYETGGHGFGANPARQNENTSAWQGLFMKWLRSLKF